MPEDVLNRANFGLLPEPEARWGSFGVSTVTNLVIAGLLVLFTMASIHHQAQLKTLQTTELVFPSEPPKISRPPVPKVKYTPPPKPELLPQPKIALPKQLQKIEPPKVQEVKLNSPVLPAVPPAPPKAVAPPPQPKVGLFASAAPTPVANNRSAPSTKVGGFGDPVGVKPNPNAKGPSQLAAVGSFANAPGVGAPGAGAARRGSVQGVNFGSGVAHGVPGGTDRGTVASSGFKNGMIGGTPGGTGTGRGSVATGGLGTTGIGGTGVAPAAIPAKPSFTLPEVLSEPAPQYTAEAKKARIQGEVTLQVRFLATGQVQVLRVVNGLGHGLDEQAMRVAEQIRFKPAMRDGQAVDHTTLIHVTFQLA
ncbi:MAG TPA: TonB family protein [Acidisarcina sp.]|nr:TonB family protein [Acidisarcina sp.]